MQSTFIIRFIDLGLLLLLGFLNLADIIQETSLIVQPAGDGAEKVEEVVSLLVRSDAGAAQYVLLYGERQGCVATSPSVLASCLAEVPATTPVMLRADEGVKVQEVVNVLDACRAGGRSCTW